MQIKCTPAQAQRLLAARSLPGNGPTSRKRSPRKSARLAVFAEIHRQNNIPKTKRFVVFVENSENPLYCVLRDAKTKLPLDDGKAAPVLALATAAAAAEIKKPAAVKAPAKAAKVPAKASKPAAKATAAPAKKTAAVAPAKKVATKVAAKAVVKAPAAKKAVVKAPAAKKAVVKAAAKKVAAKAVVKAPAKKAAAAVKAPAKKAVKK